MQCFNALLYFSNFINVLKNLNFYDVIPYDKEEPLANLLFSRLSALSLLIRIWLINELKKRRIKEIMDENYNMFLETVDERFRDFVNQINEYLTDNGCKCNIKLQKSGYVVSYVLNSSKRTLATFVSRKTGMKLRIYPEHIQEYQSFLDTLPEKVKKEIKKASVCKRLVNPDDCNSRCVKGFTFMLEGEQYQKCRYMAFQPTLSEENNPYIMQFLEKELQAGGERG